MLGYLGATLTQVCSGERAQSGSVTQRCHNSPRWETGLQSVNDVTHRKRTEDFGNFKKIRRVETRHRTRQLTFAWSRRPWAGVARDSGRGRLKSQNRKSVPLSPYVEKPLNSKIIKSFVPELRSRKVFFEFRDSYVLCIYVMNVQRTLHIFMYMAMVHSYSVQYSI